VNGQSGRAFGSARFLVGIDGPRPQWFPRWQNSVSGRVGGTGGGAVARLQSETASALDALLPSILDRAFKEEL